MREKFEKKIINEQGTGLSLPNRITMADLVANKSCKFTTGLQKDNTGTYWLAIADVDRPDRRPPVQKNDYYVVSDDIEFVNGTPKGTYALFRYGEYVPGTYDKKTGKYLLRWTCDNYQPPTNLISDGKLTPSQQEWINNSSYIKNGYSVSANTQEGCSVTPFDPKLCDRVDLAEIAPTVFYQKGVYYLYKSKTAVNKRQTEEQRKIVESYMSIGCTDEVPLANQRNPYYEVRLSQIPEFRNLFDSNFVMYCPYSAITKGNRSSVIDNIKNKLKMSSVTDDCQFAMTVIYDGLYKLKNQYARQLDLQEITYLKNVLKQCATARDERGRAFNFRYKNNYQELVRLGKDNRASLAESKTKDLTTIIREQLVEAYNRKNRRY